MCLHPAHVCGCALPCWRPGSLYPGPCLWPQSRTALCLEVAFDSADAAVGCNLPARNRGSRWARRGTSCRLPCVVGWWCRPWKTGDRPVLFPRRSRGLYRRAGQGYSGKHGTKIKVGWWKQLFRVERQGGQGRNGNQKYKWLLCLSW